MRLQCLMILLLDLQMASPTAYENSPLNGRIVSLGVTDAQQTLRLMKHAKIFTLNCLLIKKKHLKFSYSLLCWYCNFLIFFFTITCTCTCTVLCIFKLAKWTSLRSFFFLNRHNLIKLDWYACTTPLRLRSTRLI